MPVGAGNWTQPFPLDAAKGFFGAVGDNTPRWFEPQVERGLRQVEQAEPPAAALEPTLSNAIQPPPLPPGTPDAQNSGGGRWRQRRMRCGRRSCKGATCRWRRTNGARRRMNSEARPADNRIPARAGGAQSLETAGDRRAAAVAPGLLSPDLIRGSLAMTRRVGLIENLDCLVPAGHSPRVLAMTVQRDRKTLGTLLSRTRVSTRVAF